MQTYVHGYSQREEQRLRDQAGTLAQLLHSDTVYPPKSRILEAGCGVGAQTVFLAANNPEARITSIDISQDSLAKAKEAVSKRGITNVRFQKTDIFDMPFEAEGFDHIFLCFVLEHLKNPLAALKNLMRFLKKGGSLTVIEGDHGSFYCHPHTKEASLAVQCLVDLQAKAGGNALIGRQLYPLLDSAGMREVRVSPRMVYADASKPALVEGFVKNTFTAMVAGVKEQVLEQKMMDEAAWDKGIADLLNTAGPDGTFCYAFFKGSGLK
ncbi:MAG: methyltransferase domain-containing protein [Desulfobacterales bacterium]